MDLYFLWFSIRFIIVSSWIQMSRFLVLFLSFGRWLRLSVIVRGHFSRKLADFSTFGKYVCVWLSSWVWCHVRLHIFCSQNFSQHIFRELSFPQHKLKQNNGEGWDEPPVEGRVCARLAGFEGLRKESRTAVCRFLLEHFSIDCSRQSWRRGS